MLQQVDGRSVVGQTVAEWAVHMDRSLSEHTFTVSRSTGDVITNGATHEAAMHDGAVGDEDAEMARAATTVGVIVHELINA